MAVGTTMALIGLGVAAAEAGKTALQVRGANKAASIQQSSARDAMTLQRDLYGQQQRNVQPYLDVGGAANQSMGQFMRNPTIPITPFQPGARPTVPQLPQPRPNPATSTNPGMNDLWGNIASGRSGQPPLPNGLSINSALAAIGRR